MTSKTPNKRFAYLLNRDLIEDVDTRLVTAEAGPHAQDQPVSL